MVNISFSESAWHIPNVLGGKNREKTSSTEKVLSEKADKYIFSLK